METFDWKCPVLSENGERCGFYILAYTEEGLLTRQNMHFEMAHKQKALPAPEGVDANWNLTDVDKAMLRRGHVSPD